MSLHSLNSPVKMCSVSWIVQSDILDPEAISKEIKILPTKSWQKDDKYVIKNRELSHAIRYGKRYSGIWEIDSSQYVESQIIEDHIKYIVALLEPSSGFINKMIFDSDICVKLVVSCIFQGEHGSYVIDSSLLSSAAKLCQFIHYSFIGTFPENETE